MESVGGQEPQCGPIVQLYVMEELHNCYKLAKGIEYYSLRSELLVTKMDVSRTKIRLDTSISVTSNFERREYKTSTLTETS